MTANATVSNPVRRRMLGLSLHGWENVMVGFLAIAGVVALVIGIATYCVVQLQRKEAIEATERIETLRAANLALEAKLAPRSMSSQEQSALRDKLEPFAGTSVDIFVIPTGTADTVPLSRLIASILVAAKWQIRDLVTANGGQFLIGVQVGRAADAPPTVESAAQALVNGLNAANVGAVAGPLFQAAGSWMGSGPGLRQRTLLATPPAPISIMIGTKP